MLYDTLKTFGLTNHIPVAYRFFKKPQGLPYITYYENASDNFIADNRVYVKKLIYTVELCTADKDPALEADLESALDEYVWESDETYVEADQMYMKIYTLEE